MAPESGGTAVVDVVGVGRGRVAGAPRGASGVGRRASVFALRRASAARREHFRVTCVVSATCNGDAAPSLGRVRLDAGPAI